MRDLYFTLLLPPPLVQKHFCFQISGSFLISSNPTNNRPSPVSSRTPSLSASYLCPQTGRLHERSGILPYLQVHKLACYCFTVAGRNLSSSTASSMSIVSLLVFSAFHGSPRRWAWLDAEVDAWVCDTDEEQLACRIYHFYHEWWARLLSDWEEMLLHPSKLLTANTTLTNGLVEEQGLYP